MVPLVLYAAQGSAVAGSAGPNGSRPVQPISISPAMLQALLVVAGLGCCVAMSMPQVHIVAYCMDLGYGMARGSEMLSIMLAAGVISRLASGFLADRIGGIRTLLDRLGAAMPVAVVLHPVRRPRLALRRVAGVRPVARRHRALLCDHRARIHAGREAGQRVGIVIMATIVGMAIGGWMSGWIYDQTGSYAAAFLNGIAWNMLNIVVMALLLWKSRRAAGAIA